MAGRAYDAKRAPHPARSMGNLAAPAERWARERASPATVRGHDDVRVEDAQQRLEVAGSRSGHEGVDHLTLYGQIGIGLGRLGPHAPSRPTGQLPGRGRRPVDHDRDLVEAHAEHIVEHERQSLGRRQRLEHDQQGDADRVGHDGIGFGVCCGVRLRPPARSRAAPAATCRHTFRAAISGCGACPGRSDRP